MTIYLSASAIKDFMSCRYKYYYRRYASEEAEKTDAMLIGSIVHDVLEKHWDSKSVALNYIHEKCIDLAPSKINKCIDFIDNYFKYFEPITHPTDEVEKNFKVDYKKDIYIVGKYDRVLDNSVIIDWKTSRYAPKTLENDIQFILYYMSFYKETGKFPVVAYAGLANGRIIYYKPNYYHIDLLFDTIIPNMLEDIKNNRFYRDGLLKYRTCEYCSFRKHCFSEIDDELVRGDITNI